MKEGLSILLPWLRRRGATKGGRAALPRSKKAAVAAAGGHSRSTQDHLGARVGPRPEALDWPRKPPPAAAAPGARAHRAQLTQPGASSSPHREAGSVDELAASGGCVSRTASRLWGLQVACRATIL
eukprot:scaffold4547_cov335-Prasinococcus_capsulatus_cf.AAC.3